MAVLESFSLKGKVGLVTGGAGLYGWQVVQTLAEAGAKTFAADCDIEKQEDVAKRLRADGLDVTAVQYDQSDEESIQAMLREIVAQAGGVDILVNNAVLRPMKEGWSSPAKDFARSMEVNATGIFMMTRTFGNHMAERGKGSIINISSIQGMIGPDYTLYEGLDMPVPPDYYFHKGGAIQLTRHAASTLGPKGVRVNAISPGGLLGGQGEEFIKRYSARTFLGRMANQEDLKGAIVFLASDASAYITGANIPVDAGYTAK